MAPLEVEEMKEDSGTTANSTRRRERVDSSSYDSYGKVKRSYRTVPNKRDFKMPSSKTKTAVSKRGSVRSPASTDVHQIPSVHTTTAQLRRRHRRRISNQSVSTSNSSDSNESEDRDGLGPEVDHREVLENARARLTSPSMISTLTSLTTATNSSGGSSGSNSTVTQASQASSDRKRRLQAAEIKEDSGNEEMREMPVSPAVPDPPDVFAYLEEDQDDDEHDEDAEEQDYVPPNWPQSDADVTSSPEMKTRERSTSSSASSSFHSDSSTFDTAIVDNDHDSSTDRSTSPEINTKESRDVESLASPTTPSRRRIQPSSSGPIDELNADPEVPSSPAAAKFAAQMLAAQHRQSLHTSPKARSPYPFTGFSPQRVAPEPPFPAPFAVPSPIPQPFTFTAHPPRSTHLATSPRLHQRRSSGTVAKSPTFAIDRNEDIQEQSTLDSRALSGYERIASAYSSKSLTSELKISPIYRKFGALNHRVLLYLQDEISLLEDELARLDAVDDSSRALILTRPASSIPTSDDSDGNENGDKEVAKRTQTHYPSSRRLPQDRELEYHRAEIIAKLSYKLSQYNSTLTSFHTLESSLPAAQAKEIQACQAFLESETPVVEAEMGFLEHDDDLVSVSSSSATPSRAQKRVTFARGTSSSSSSARSSSATSHAGAVAIAVAASILLPILTFAVIPGFLGRMVVAMLVAAGVAGMLVLAGRVGAGWVCGREGAVVGGVYVGFMVVVAGWVG